MPRPKRYASEAEKQAAYRLRKKLLGLGIKKAEVDTGDDLGKDVALVRNPEYEKAEIEVQVHGSFYDPRNPEKVPMGVPEKEWRYALERAGRARKYAEMFPNHVRPSEEKFWNPVWQWENEVRGRFGGIVGGSLSGTRNQHGRD